MSTAKKAPTKRRTEPSDGAAAPSGEDILRALTKPPHGATGYLSDVGWLTPERETVIDAALATLVEAARQHAIVGSPEHTAWTLERLAAVIRQGRKGAIPGPQANRRRCSKRLAPAMAPMPQEILKVIAASAPIPAAQVGKKLHEFGPGAFGASADAIAKAITRIRAKGPTDRLLEELRKWIGNSMQQSGLRLADSDRERFANAVILAAVEGGETERDK